VVGVFTFVVSAVVWFILKATMGIRVSEEAEINGLDMAELGMDAYPDLQHIARALRHILRNTRISYICGAAT